MTGNGRLRVAAVLTLAMGSVAGGVAWGRPSPASTPPTTVTARTLPYSDSGPGLAHRGRAVPSSQLGVRSFVNAEDGFALADVGQAQYPANTTDGGRTWRVDGPHFHIDAANGPDAVVGTGVTGQRTYFAYGGWSGGNTVVVTTDAGQHWWRAYFEGVPLTVERTYSNGAPGLLSLVEVNPGQFWAYVSRDGGRHWYYQRHFM